MTVTEQLDALGSWSLTLKADCPKEVLDQLGYFGHVVILRGDVDVSQADPTGLLRQARYVGVLREKPTDARTLSGSGMLFWLGDEDKKGKLLESPLTLTAKSLTYCVGAVLPPAVAVGTIHDPGGTYSGTHQWEVPRTTLDTITTAFGVEYRVNGDATVDVGSQAQLYRATPTTILSARGAGEDMDVQSVGTAFAPDTTAVDYTTRVVLLGQTTAAGGTSTPFAEASVNAATVPYSDLHGNTVAFTRAISDSGQTSGSVAAAAQLALNEYNRLKNVVKVTAENFEVSGNIVVGDNAWVFDPDNGIYDAGQQLDFRGEVIHPAIVRISAATWPVTREHTVAFRTGAGVMVDLTRWVAWETGSTDITIGDLPKTLTSGSNAVQDRVNSAPDVSVPNPPTGLSLATTSTQSSTGQSTATVTASWTAPALNTDGSVLQDLDYYLVQYRWHGRAPLWDSRISPTTSIDIPGLAVGLLYDVQVAAVDTTGHTSAFTALAQITAAVDSTAPNPPADLTVTDFRGQGRLVYAGTDSTGNPMPADANRVDVHEGTTSGFTPTAATLIDSLTPFAAGVSYASVAAGVTHYFKAVAVDNSGNWSTPSAAVAFTGRLVNNGDVSDLNVGKLTAGIMSADVTISGRFATALTGARVELNSLGLQKWDASNNLLVSLTGTDNLLVGVFKTALSGRRIEIGAAGSGGEIDFFAPDGTQALIRAYTESTGLEAMQFGVKVTATSDPFWNRINYNNDHNGWSNYRSNRHDFYIGGPNGAGGTDTTAWAGQFTVNHTSNFGATATTRLLINGTVLQVNDVTGIGRFLINANDSIFWDASSNARMQITTSNTNFWGGPFSSTGQLQIIPGAQSGSTMGAPGVILFTPQVGGTGGYWTGGITYSIVSDGTLGGVAVYDGGTTFIPIKASAFQVSSDRAGKTEIADADIDALSILKSMTLKTYRQRPPRGPRHVREVERGDGLKLAEDAGPVKGWKPPVMPVEIGLIAQETHELIRRESPDGTLGVSLYPYVALLHKGLLELIDRIEKGQAA
jgi:hypothetical protein